MAQYYDDRFYANANIKSTLIRKLLNAGMAGQGDIGGTIVGVGSATIGIAKKCVAFGLFLRPAGFAADVRLEKDGVPIAIIHPDTDGIEVANMIFADDTAGTWVIFNLTGVTLAFNGGNSTDFSIENPMTPVGYWAQYLTQSNATNSTKQPKVRIL